MMINHWLLSFKAASFWTRGGTGVKDDPFTLVHESAADDVVVGVLT